MFEENNGKQFLEKKITRKTDEKAIYYTSTSRIIVFFNTRSRFSEQKFFGHVLLLLKSRTIHGVIIKTVLNPLKLNGQATHLTAVNVCMNRN